MGSPGSPEAPYLFQWLGAGHLQADARSKKWPAGWGRVPLTSGILSVALGATIWIGGPWAGRELAVRLLLVLLVWSSVMAPWLVWCRLVRDWETIASGLTRAEGDDWFRDRLEPYATSSSLYRATAIVAPTLGLVVLALHLGGVQLGWTDALLFAVGTPAVATATQLTWMSIRVFWDIGQMDPDALGLLEGSPLDTPWVRKTTGLVRWEAGLGALLFAVLASPVTVAFWDADPGIGLGVPFAFGLLLLIPLAAVLVAGIGGPRWVSQPAREAHEELMSEMKTALYRAWKKATADPPTTSEPPGDLPLTSAALIAASTATPTRSNWRDAAQISLAAGPLAAQVLTLLAR